MSSLTCVDLTFYIDCLTAKQDMNASPCGLSRFTCGPLRSCAVHCGLSWALAVLCSPLLSLAVRFGPSWSLAVLCSPLLSLAVHCGPSWSLAVLCSPCCSLQSTALLRGPLQFHYGPSWSIANHRGSLSVPRCTFQSIVVSRGPLRSFAVHCCPLRSLVVPLRSIVVPLRSIVVHCSPLRFPCGTSWSIAVLFGPLFFLAISLRFSLAVFCVPLRSIATTCGVLRPLRSIAAPCFPLRSLGIVVHCCPLRSLTVLRGRL